MASTKSPEPDTTGRDTSGRDGAEHSNDGSGAPQREVPPIPPPAASGFTPPQGNRFFSWMRGLGIQRQPGWIGGVSSGLGVRLGIDPLIVRGIIVVIAVLGGPALLLYAAAWLLLPDTNDRIHAEELGRGRFDPALIGIGVMALLSLLPLNQGFWYAGALYWGDPGWGASLGRVSWTALLLAAIIAFVIWAARRASNTSPTVTPATTDDRPETIPSVPAESAAAPTATSSTTDQVPDAALAGSAATLAASAGTASAIPAIPAVTAAALTAPGPPTVPGPDAAPDELQAWKEQQALWKQQHAEWRAQQTATERELRQQRAAESRERALLTSAEHVERARLRRLANPRLNAATVFTVLGAALVAGGIAALVASTTLAFAGYEVTVALAGAALVLGLAIILAGIFRRRSGVLGFFAVLAILGLLVSATVPRDRTLLPFSADLGGSPLTTAAEQSPRYLQPVGSLYLHVSSVSHGGVVDVRQGIGSIHIEVWEGASARLEIISMSGNVYTFDASGQRQSFGEGSSEPRPVGDEWHWNSTVGTVSAETVTIRVWQGEGTIYIYDQNQQATDDDNDEDTTP